MGTDATTGTPYLVDLMHGRAFVSFLNHLIAHRPSGSVLSSS